MDNLILSSKVQTEIFIGSDQSEYMKFNLICDKIICEYDTQNESDGFGGNKGIRTIVFLDNNEFYVLRQVGGYATPQCVNYNETPTITKLTEFPSEFKLTDHE